MIQYSVGGIKPLANDFLFFCFQVLDLDITPVLARAKIDDLHAHYGEAGERDIDVEIGDFDDIVSAAETDAMTFDFENNTIR